jgi:putative two-component system response regulator
MAEDTFANEIHEQSLKARILVVDDNETNVALLEAILDGDGYTNISSTTDPRKVKALFQKWRYDLVVLDIQMPHMDGLEVMEQLRLVTELDYMPVLVLTADTNPETRLQALEIGAKDFIAKPFEHAEFLHRVRNMLEVRLLYKRQRWQAEHFEAMVRERTTELHETRLEIIRRLGRAGEYRDNETGMHIMRMSKGCQRLALAAGLDENQAALILQASPMHDVGKIGIPDRILLKPGRLEGEEWEIMKTHAEIGAKILEGHSSDIMELARSIALSHHEKWDGSGYPYGSKDVAIPIEGRIAAVCDVFDALTSERPYKKAWSVEDGMDFIKDNAGSHFDPELTRLFTEILPEILAIKEKYAEDAEGSAMAPHLMLIREALGAD